MVGSWSSSHTILLASPFYQTTSIDLATEDLPDDGQPWDGKHSNGVHHFDHVVFEVVLAQGPVESE